MKHLFLYLAAIFVALSAAACGDDDNNQPAGIPSDFKCVHSEIAFPMEGGDGIITVVSAVKPEVTVSDAWVSVGNTTVQGTNNNIYKITISAAANADGNDRNAKAVVKAGPDTAEVNLVQTGKPTVEVDKESLAEAQKPVSKDGGNFSIKLVTNQEVKAESTVSWIAVTSTRAMEEKTISYTVAANNTPSVREGSLVITPAANSGLSPLTVTISQQAGESGTLLDLSATDIARNIKAGVNIGNTLEAINNSVPSETAWGNPKVNEEYIKGLKQLGFNAVRIPCAWDGYVTDKNNNTIDPAWLNRVHEVVGWIVANDMYAIVNIHWDGGWLEESCSNGYDENVNKKQHDYWTQIAEKLADYDQHLLFAGMNEPGYQNGAENKAVEAIMKYQQTFVDAVRATGGNNSKRCLIHQAPQTNIDKAVDGTYSLPNDPVENLAMAEVHFYDPSDYTIMSNDGDWFAGSVVKLYWGSEFHVSGSKRNCEWGEESHVDTQFKKVYDKFASAGVPVILGEYCVSTRNAADFSDFNKASFEGGRAYWTEYVTKTARKNGCVPFYWETGGDINRTNGSARNAYAIDAIMKGASESDYPF